MTWTRLLEQGRVERHAATRRELDDLRALVARNLNDAALPGLSADNTLGLVYEAALVLAKMAIAAAGYRVKGHAHHKSTFDVVTLALGSGAQEAADFFELCRRSRNVISYDAAGVISKGQAAEALAEAVAFEATVESWIASTHPLLQRQDR